MSETTETTEATKCAVPAGGGLVKCIGTTCPFYTPWEPGRLLSWERAERSARVDACYRHRTKDK